MYSKCLENLEPKRFFEIFDRLCQIPHGSHNEKAISDYIKDFCVKLNLETYQDDYWNLIIKKPATSGYENVPTVVLQAHLDMVCQKTANSSHDFYKDPIKLRVDGDVLSADETTLGADDATGVAFAMCVLESSDIPHPALEVVLTSNEEAGMSGVNNLDFSKINGRVVLNLDCSDEGIVVGCAATLVQSVSLPIIREVPVDSHTYFCVSVSGLKGGHTGLVAIQERANANAILGRVVQDLFNKVPLKLVSFVGGVVDNAIPTEGQCVIAVPDADIKTIEESIEHWQEILKKEYKAKDAAIKIECSIVESDIIPCITKDTKRFLDFMNLVPNGLISTSKDVEGLAELSANLGHVKTEDKLLNMRLMCRARYASGKQLFRQRLECLADLVGAQVQTKSDAPGWDFNPDSRLSSLIQKVFSKEYGDQIIVEVSHGGNECGVFSLNFPDADIVCSGTKITGAHTTEESLKISTIQKEWNMLCCTLAAMLEY